MTPARSSPDHPPAARRAAGPAVGAAFRPRLSRLAGCAWRRRGKPSLATLEDPLVDRLVWRALQRGCGAVIARAPRAAIDCNRAEDEVDPSVDRRRAAAAGSARGRAAGSGSSRRGRQQHGYLWRRPITPEQLDERLDQAHRPYHDAIEEQLGLLLDRFGCALLLDCHSMPPPPAGVPPIVFGDCRGRTADAWVSARGAARLPSRCGLRGRAQRSVRRRACDRASRAPGATASTRCRSRSTARCYLDASAPIEARARDSTDVATLIEDACVELGEALLGTPVRDGRRIRSA